MENRNTKILSEFIFLPRFFQALNKFNPTSFGRHLISSIAIRLGVLPKDGVHKVKSNVSMFLEMKDYIDRSIYFDSFEFNIRKIILNNIKEGDTFLDIGANIGYFSLLVSKVVGDEGRIIAFEPNPITIGRLKKNINLNLCGNIELMEVALSNEEGEVQLFCPQDETHGFTSMRNQGWQQAEIYKVKTKLLDDLLPINISSIDLIKIDVEGAELLVFKGAKSTITKFRPKIILELNENAAKNFGYDILEVVRLLLSYNPNYKLTFIEEHSSRLITLEELVVKSIRNGNIFFH